MLTDLEALAEIVTQKRTALGYVELAPGGLCVYGYNSYQKSKAVQMDGEPHKPREQRDYSLLFDPLDDAMLAQCTPLARVLDALSGALRPLLGPRITDRLELLHAHSLDQSSRFVQFSVHDDAEENFRSRKYAWWYGKHAEHDAEAKLTKIEKRKLQGRKVGEVDVMDRQVELTVVIPLRLRAAPRASVHVCGHTGVEYELGGARVFPAAAKHETLVAGPGDVKLTVFFGHWVDPEDRSTTWVQ